MREHPEPEVISQYVRIAESLGRYRELAVGLREQIDQQAKPSLLQYMRLAYTFDRINRDLAPRRFTAGSPATLSG